MALGLIFATSTKGLFSKNGRLPWKCPADMSLFKRVTTGSYVFMGKNTMRSLVKPLPNRYNYVITSNPENCYEGFFPINSLHNIKEFAKKENVWIIGGIPLLESFLNDADVNVIVHNEINEEQILESGDNVTYFNPKILSQLQKDTFALNDNVLCNIYYPLRRKNLLPKLDNDYLDIGKLLLHSPVRKTRNGNVRSNFDPSLSITGSFENGFPILKSKKVWWKGVAEELKFFLSGSTDTSILSKQNIKIWEGNTSKEFLIDNNKNHLNPGDMGPMYGFQWRHFGETYQGMNHIYKGLDQVENVINTLITDPSSRRILLTTYNPAQASEGVLYPCHGLITQFYVDNLFRVSLKTYQRSADWFLGVPFNISSYALLLSYIVEEVNKRQYTKIYKPHNVSIIFGDSHLYEEHVNPFLEQYITSLHCTPSTIEPQLEGFDLKYYLPNRNIKAPMIA